VQAVVAAVTRSVGWGLVGMALGLLVPRGVAAQDDIPPSPSPPPPRVVAPQLVEFVDAPLPEAARLSELAGQVVRVGLRLTVDTEGRVSEVQVTEPAGFGLDEAAVQAARRFRFEPARRDGVPMPARIPFVYEFDLPPREASAPTPEDDRPVEDAAEPEDPGLASAGVLEVTVEGESAADRRRHSAEAVQVIELERDQRRTADLGEVLARSFGVGVQRAGGLGSRTRFSLNGLTDDRVRFFLDGIPLEFTGFPPPVAAANATGFANVPVTLVDRVEIFSGVVPVRFATDALGGAVDLVTDDDLVGTQGSASYQGGSFGTHRLSIAGSNLDDTTGLFTRVSGFFDVAENDYPIDVEVPDERGRLSDEEVYRFHDNYRAGGGIVEVGLVDRPWADRLMLRGFVTSFGQQIQNNPVMTVPYGEVESNTLSAGASLRYQHDIQEDAGVRLTGGYAFRRIDFEDLGDCRYDWFGRCATELAQAGEIDGQARDQRLWENTGYARLVAFWRPADGHELSMSVGPTYTTRTGDDRTQTNPDDTDPLTAQQDLFQLISGVEYEVDFLSGRVENIAFVKSYTQALRSEEPLPGGLLRRQDRTTHRFGVGNSTRIWLVDRTLYAKLSYEHATLLPRPDQVFGNGVLIVPNLELQPEVSHNVYLEVTVEDLETAVGTWSLTARGQIYELDQLLVLLGNDQTLSWQNVFGARLLTVHGEVRWFAPGDWLGITANASYQDFRNTSDQGTFGDFQGDRIPNQPYLFANGEARLRATQVVADKDDLALIWNVRYVHEFFRSWESVGLRAFKQTIPSQLTHTLGLVYAVLGDPLMLSFSAEAQNLTDARVFDFFGVQRPGRAFFFKTTAEY